MDMREKELAFENQSFRRYSSRLEEQDRETRSHCEECGEPCALVQDLEISACHFAKVVWKEEK